MKSTSGGVESDGICVFVYPVEQHEPRTINRHVDARPSAFECFYKVYSMASPEVRTELENRSCFLIFLIAQKRVCPP